MMAFSFLGQFEQVQRQILSPASPGHTASGGIGWRFSSQDSFCQWKFFGGVNGGCWAIANAIIL